MGETRRGQRTHMELVGTHYVRVTRVLCLDSEIREMKSEDPRRRARSPFSVKCRQKPEVVNALSLHEGKVLMKEGNLYIEYQMAATSISGCNRKHEADDDDDKIYEYDLISIPRGCQIRRLVFWNAMYSSTSRWKVGSSRKCSSWICCS